MVGLGTGAVRAGGHWDTLGGSVRINLNNGTVNFKVDGLFLSYGSLFEYQGSDFTSPPISGIQIGQTGGVTQVKGTLVCNLDGTYGVNSIQIDTPATTLDLQGNASFSGTFSGSLPAVCSSNTPYGQADDAFMIRIVSCPTVATPCPFADLWIAFGAVLRTH